jgi:hypothetical protein
MEFLKRNKLKLFAVLCFVFLTASIYDIEATRLRIGNGYIKDTLTGGLVTRRMYINDSLNTNKLNINSGGSINSDLLSLKSGEIDLQTKSGNYIIVLDSIQGLTAHRRIQTNQAGSTVSSGTTITLGGDGNFFTVSGNTTIQNIALTNWNSGAIVYLYFTGTPTIDEGAGNISNTAGDITVTAGQVYEFILLGGATWKRVL